MHIPFSSTRLAGLLAVMTLASGCLASFPSHDDAGPQPVFDPTIFFAGRTHGEGTLDMRVGTDRTLRVEGTGHTAADGRFQLDQTVTYGDGTVETRTWMLKRIDATHYTASLSDAKGDVTAETTGNLFHLRYLLRQPAVYMEQWLYLQPGGRTVSNRAQVTVLGVPWARLSETITRGE